MEIPMDRALLDNTASASTSKSTDMQVVRSPTPRNPKLEGSNGTQADIADLSYKLTGLLALQTLYSIAIKENSSVRTHVQRLEILCSQLRDRLSSEPSRSGAENTRSNSPSEYCEESECKRCVSLLSDSFRSMQMKIMRLEKMVHGIEGMSATGLILQNHELKEACKYQLSAIEDLESEMAMYRRIYGSASGYTGQEPFHGNPSAITELSEMEKLLSFERTLVVEAGKRLQDKIHEVDALRQELDFERYGRRQSQQNLSEILNDFVRCCLEIPYVAKDMELKTAFEELLDKSTQLAADMRDDLTAAVQVASEDGSRLDFLRDFSLNVLPGENVEDLSIVEARSKIVELQELLCQLSRNAKRNVIEQMRKFKHAAMKVKDLEERLRKSHADRQFVDEQMSGEIRKQRAIIDQFEQSLGVRSSYATKASQSVRALVELLEGQKVELNTENEELRTEVESLKQQLHSLLDTNSKLVSEVERLQAEAVEEATAAVQADLAALRSQCQDLQQEAGTAKEKYDLQDEHLKQERESRRSVEERKASLECQIEVYETEIREYRASNASLVESKRLLTAQVADLDRELRKLTGSHGLVRFQSLGEPEQRVSGSVHYTGRDSPLLQRVSRASTNSLPTKAFVSENSSSLNDAQLNGPITSAFVSSNVATERLPLVPVLTQPNQLSRGESLGLTGTSSFDSIGADSSPLNPRFSLLHRASSSTSGNATEQAGSGLGRPSSSGFGGQRNILCSRSVSSTSFLRSQQRDTMQCLRCGARYLVTNLDNYEKHIRDCYSEVH